MAERDERAGARDDAGNKRDVDAAIRDKFGDDGEQRPREEAARDRWDSAEDRRAAAEDRRASDEDAQDESG